MIKYKKKKKKKREKRVNYFLTGEVLSEMNDNFSPVKLSKHFNCPYNADKKVEEMVLSHVIGENVSIGDYLSISLII